MNNKRFMITGSKRIQEKAKRLNLLIPPAILFCLLVLMIFFNLSAFAQVKIGDNPGNLTPSSLLEMESSNKGFLVPRLTTVQQNAIANPATGLLLYNTNSNSFKYYNGTTWVDVSGTSLWVVNGNDISNTNSGKVGIGTSIPAYTLDVNGQMRSTNIRIGTGANTVSISNNSGGSYELSLPASLPTNGTNYLTVSTSGALGYSSASLPPQKVSDELPSGAIVMAEPTDAKNFSNSFQNLGSATLALDDPTDPVFWNVVNSKSGPYNLDNYLNMLQVGTGAYVMKVGATMWQYDVQAASAVKLVDLPIALNAINYTWIDRDNKVFYFLGSNATGATVFYKYDYASASFTSLNTTDPGGIPILRTGSGNPGVSVSGYFVLYGGVASGSGIVRNDGVKYNLQTGLWEPIPTPPVVYGSTPRTIMGAVAKGDSIFLTGGRCGLSSTTCSGVNNLSAWYVPSTNVWSDVNNGSLSVTNVNGGIYLPGANKLYVRYPSGASSTDVIWNIATNAPTIIGSDIVGFPNTVFNRTESSFDVIKGNVVQRLNLGTNSLSTIVSLPSTNFTIADTSRLLITTLTSNNAEGSLYDYNKTTNSLNLLNTISEANWTQRNATRMGNTSNYVSYALLDGDMLQVIKYNISTQTETKRFTVNAPGFISNNNVIANDSVLYILGTFSSSNQFWVINVNTETINSVTPAPYVSTSPKVLYLNGSKLLYIGSAPNLGSIYDFSAGPASGVWSNINPSGAPSGSFQFAYKGDSVFVQSFGASNRVDMFNIALNSWTSLANNSNNSPDVNPSKVIGSKWYTYNMPTSSSAKISVYDILTNSWSDLVTSGEPLNVFVRRDMLYNPDKNQLILIGGSASGTTVPDLSMPMEIIDLSTGAVTRKNGIYLYGMTLINQFGGASYIGGNTFFNSLINLFIRTGAATRKFNLMQKK